MPAPLLPESKTVAVPELGGDVVVRPLLLSHRLALAQSARNGANFSHITRLLSYAVVDGEGESLFDVDEWEKWGSLHMESTLMLWDVAYELSGLGGDVEKKSTAQSSSSP